MGTSSASARIAAPIAAYVVALVVAVLLGGASGLLGTLAGGVLGGAIVLAAATTRRPAEVGQLPVDPERWIDPVAGLPTTEKLLADLQSALSHGADTQALTLYLFSLDGFKHYNDAYGDACGDALLGWLARKLRDAVGDYGGAYRLRGGSFALLAGGSERFTSGLCASAAQSLAEVGDGFQIYCDVGTAALPKEASSPQAALELVTRRARKRSTERHVRSGRRPPADAQEALRLIGPRDDVAELAAVVGRRLGVPEAEIENLQSAVYLCDIGNVAVPHAVLGHSGKLFGHEWQFILLHTLVGERLLAGGLGMDAVARLVRSSHERWDGSGYPDGLPGTAIPLGSRIVFVCSAFQDMTSDRPHRAALDPDDALAQLQLGAGTQFDPEVVSAFRDAFTASAEAAARPRAEASA
jgi:two-component system cell cycle response regulator